MLWQQPACGRWRYLFCLWDPAYWYGNLMWESQPNATAQSDTRNQWAADWKPWRPNSRSAPFITTWTLWLPQSFCKTESGMHSSTFAHFTLVWALWRMCDTNLCSFHTGLGQSSNLFLSKSATKSVSSLHLPSYYWFTLQFYNKKNTRSNYYPNSISTYIPKILILIPCRLLEGNCYQESDPNFASGSI